MARDKSEAAEVGVRTGRDPVLLAWYQYYVRGNETHGMFIGLWPPTLLAFSNAVRINDIRRKVENESSKLFDRLL